MNNDENIPPLHYRVFAKLFGKMCYMAFFKLGMIYYNKLAVSHDGKAAFFAQDNWTMVKMATDYLEERNDFDGSEQTTGRF